MYAALVCARWSQVVRHTNIMALYGTLPLKSKWAASAMHLTVHTLHDKDTLYSHSTIGPSCTAYGPTKHSSLHKADKYNYLGLSQSIYGMSYKLAIVLLAYLMLPNSKNIMPSTYMKTSQLPYWFLIVLLCIIKLVNWTICSWSLCYILKLVILIYCQAV